MADEKTQDDKVADLANDPAFKQMQAVMTTLGRSVKALTDGQSGLQSSINKLTTDGVKMNAPTPKAPAVEADDLDEMSQSALAGHIIGEVSKLMDTKTKTLDSKINDTTASFSRSLNKDKLTAFVETNPDIVELTEEVKAAMTENPKLTFDRAYTLVKAELPAERRTELEAKYTKDDDTVTKSATPFGGLTPTSGDYAAEETDADMSAEDAAESAWQELTEEFPGIEEVG
jgi:hypothetical protein